MSKQKHKKRQRVCAPWVFPSKWQPRTIQPVSEGWYRVKFTAKSDKAYWRWYDPSRTAWYMPMRDDAPTYTPPQNVPVVCSAFGAVDGDVWQGCL